MNILRKTSFTAFSAMIIVILSILINSLYAQTGTESIAKNSEKSGRTAAEPFVQKTHSSKDSNGQPSPAPSTSSRNVDVHTTPATGASPRHAGDRSISVREPTMIDTTTTGSAQGISVSTSDDISAIVYSDGGDRGSNRVYVTVSDGRGIDWKTPFPVDSDRTGAPKHTQSDSIVVKGSSIYVAWKDERFSSTKPDLFFNVSHDGGETWYGEELIDNAYSPGDIPGNSAAVRDWRMLVTSDPGGGDDHVFILFTVEPDKYAPLPPGEHAAEELYLVTSHDGGIYFMPPVHVPQSITPGSADIDKIAISGEGEHISVVWQDDRNGSSFNDIWFQHSHDAGSSWENYDKSLKTVPAGATDASGNIGIAQAGTTVIAVWQEYRQSSSNEELRANVSFDLGATWLASDMQIGNYLGGEYDVDSAAVFIPEAPQTSLPVIRALTPMITWTDNRTGSDEVYVAVSDDGGITWNETMVSDSGGRFPSFIGGDNSPGLAWIGREMSDSAGTSFFSITGSSWSSTFDYADMPGFQIDSIDSAFNPLYDNFLCAWLADDRRIEDNINSYHVYVGGYRPQTCHGVIEELAGGSTKIRFDVSHWPVTVPWIENDLYFGVLISSGTGSFILPFGDGRKTGLLPNPFLASSIAMIPGKLSGYISGGSGSTKSIGIPDLSQIPRGTVFYYSAVGYNPYRGSAVFGYITDVREFSTDSL